MVAAPKLRKRENVFTPNVEGEKLPDLLKIAAIYGPNASGKSNLIIALSVIGHMARLKPSIENAPLPVKPFRFDAALAHQPSFFEMHFVQDGQRYEFSLSATQERIIEERLIAYPKGKETLLYERRYLEDGEKYTFGDELEGGGELHKAWRKLTSPKMMFIAQAVANSSEEFNQLRKPFIWLAHKIYIAGDMGDLAMASQQLAKDSNYIAEEISTFLQEIDVPVTEIKFNSPSIQSNDKEFNVNFTYYKTDKDILDENIDDDKAKIKTRTILIHKTLLGEASFDFHEESKGTQNLIGFWLPWSLINYENDVFRVLVVDELDSSLHPNIVASLLEQQLKSKLSAQLIFTTHDTHIMDTKLLRRDQFWITERDANGATQLRSIHDFQGRESEDLEKRYYEGRYRGLPLIKKRQ